MSLSREETAAGYEYAEDAEPEVDAAEDPEVDPLADFEPEQAEQIRAMLAERDQAVRASVRQGLQEHGLDLTEDGRPALRDAQKLGWLGVGNTAPAPPVQRSAPAPVPEPDLDAEIPDPMMDPAGYRKWFSGEIQRAMSPFAEALSEERAARVETAIDIAMGKVAGAVGSFAPRFADLLSHPEFDARMRQTLSQVQPKEWKDPQNLARLVGMLSVDLDGGKAPSTSTSRSTRDEQGRFAADTGRSVLSRATLGQGSPSREAGRQTRGIEPTDIDVAIAARLSEFQGYAVSPEEVAKNRLDTTGDAAAVERGERLKKMRGRR